MQFINPIRKSLMFAGSSFAAVSSQMAFAQQPPAAQAPQAIEAINYDGDIVVTAQKRKQSINDVGISVTAISEQELVSKGIMDVADLARIVPGFTFVQANLNSPVYSIRGIGFYETSLSASPAVTVYVDEAPLPYSALTPGAALDLERVEVLKGPQGLFYGQNSTGGAVNYIAAKPTDDPTAGMDLSFGRFATADWQGFISGPLSSTIKARLAVRTVQGGDWQYSYTRKASRGQKDLLQSRAIIDWDPSERFKVQLTASGWRDKSDSPSGQLFAITPLIPGTLNPAIANYPFAPANPRATDWNVGEPFKKDDSFYQGSLRADYELTDAITLTSLTSYGKYKTGTAQDLDATPFAESDVLLTGRVKTFYQELRLAGSTDRLNWGVGGNYGKDTIFDQQNTSSGDSTAGTITGGGPLLQDLFLNRTDQRIETYSGFANVEYEIVDNLRLQGGVRYTDVQRDFNSCTAPVTATAAASMSIILNSVRGAFGLAPLPAIGPGDCSVVGRNFVFGDVTDQLKENNVSWKVGATYKLDQGGLLYANASKGYKAGGFPTTSSFSIDQYAAVPQESVLAYEAGFKLPLLDRKLQLNGAVFYYDYKDKQIRGKTPDIVFGPLDALVTVPKSRVVGAEFDIIVRPVEGLTLSANGTYLDTKVKTFTGFSEDGVPNVNYAGSRFPYSPKFQTNGDIQYVFPVSGSINATIGGDVSYRTASSAYFGNPVLLRIPSYTLLGLRAGISAPDDSWRFQIWGRNITNEYYWTNVTYRFLDVSQRYAGMPATYGATFSYRFN